MTNLAVVYYWNVKDIIGFAIYGIVLLVLFGGLLYDKIKGGNSWKDNFKR
jgi:hypothetical protein